MTRLAGRRVAVVFTVDQDAGDDVTRDRIEETLGRLVAEDATDLGTFATYQRVEWL